MTEDERRAGRELGRMSADIDHLKTWKNGADADLDRLKVGQATHGQRITLIWSIITAIGLALLGVLAKLAGGYL